MTFSCFTALVNFCAFYLKWLVNENSSCIIALPSLSCSCVCDCCTHQWSHKCFVDVCLQKPSFLFPVVFPERKLHHSYKKSGLCFILVTLQSNLNIYKINPVTFNLFKVFFLSPCVQKHSGSQQQFSYLLSLLASKFPVETPEAETFNASVAPTWLQCGFAKPIWSV